MLVGDKLKKIRELKNFTQEYMATKLDMSQSGYGKIERDETEISYQKLEKIAEVFGIKVEDIINFNEKLVFNVMHNQTGNGYVINQGISDKEKELYDQIIAQQKDEIAYLRGLIEKLSIK